MMLGRLPSIQMPNTCIIIILNFNKKYGNNNIILRLSFQLEPNNE